MGIEPTPSAWQALVLTVILHLHMVGTRGLEPLFFHTTFWGVPSTLHRFAHAIGSFFCSFYSHSLLYYLSYPVRSYPHKTLGPVGHQSMIWSRRQESNLQPTDYWCGGPDSNRNLLTLLVLTILPLNDLHKSVALPIAPRRHKQDRFGWFNGVLPLNYSPIFRALKRP